MLNAMVSVPGLVLASMIACRSDPAPLSVVLVTVKVAPRAGGVEKHDGYRRDECDPDQTPPSRRVQSSDV